MKQKNKQELSYFRLKLRSYMSEHHPEKLQDTEFITARADMALTVYCDAVAQGFTHIEAESMASEALYQGLHFSKYDTLISVLENEFERELPAPLPEKLVPILLSNKAVQATFDKFGLTDTLASDEQYGRLYTELTGTIVLLIESNNPNGQTDGGSKPEGVVGKGGARKVPDAVSYRAKVQRQPVCPDKVESCGWREESPPQDFSVSRWYCHFLYPCGRIHLSQPCRAGLP